VNLSLHGITATLHGDELELDALAPSDDENIRLRPLPSPDLSPSSTQIATELKPWDILYWSLKKQ
jgi:hypothetical protein